MKKKVHTKLFVFYFCVMSMIPFAGCKHIMALLNAAFKKPTMTYKTMHLKNVSFKGMNMDFEFLLNNPNAVGVTLSSLRYKLDIDGSTLLQGTSSRSIRVEANGSSPVRLPLGVEFRKFVKSMMAFFQKRDYVPYAIAVEFGIETPIGNITIPLSHKANVPVPKLPEIALSRVDVRVVKETKTIPIIGTKFQIPTGAQIDIALNMRQKGKFPVNLRGLNYNVTMGGTSLMKASTRPGNLKVGGAQLVKIPIRLGQRQAITLIRSIVNKKFDLALNGALDLGAFKLPLKFDANSTKKLNLPATGNLSTLLQALTKFKIPGM